MQRVEAVSGKGCAVKPSARYSTLQDLDAGRHTEIDMFSGALIRMGRELGIPTPYNEFAYHMIKALEEKNYEQAFTHIHNLKGLAMNLGLTPLLVPAQELCEELRDGEPERELKPLLDEVAAAYQKVLGIVERLD